MPLIALEESTDIQIRLWRITESEAELEAMVTESDRESAARFGSVDRRRTHLAWRAALRSMRLDAEVIYDQVGAPFLNSGERLGVSHTWGGCNGEGLAAVVISGSVDVERADREITAAMRRRILGVDEERLEDSARDDFAITAWCAKEVYYKLRGGLLHDIRIGHSDLANGTIVCGKVEMMVERVEDWIVVFYKE